MELTTANKDSEIGRSCLNCMYRYLSPDDEHCVRCVHSNVDKNEKGETHWVQQKDETDWLKELLTLIEDFELGRNCANCAYLSRSENYEPCSSCIHSKTFGYGTGESHWYPMDPDERDDFKGEEGCLMITTCNKDNELGRNCGNCMHTDLSDHDEPCVCCVHTRADRNEKGETHWEPKKKTEEKDNEKKKEKAFVTTIRGRDYICTPGFSCLECVALDEFGVTWGIHSLGPYSED